MIGNVLLTLGILSLIASVLSLYWDNSKQKKKYTGALKDAANEIKNLKTEINSLSKLRSMFKPAKPIQLVMARVNIDNSVLQNRIEVLLAEKKVWEKQALEAAELMRQKNEQIGNLEYNLGIKDSEIEKLIWEKEVFEENLPTNLKPELEKLKQEKHSKYNQGRIIASQELMEVV